MAITLGGTGAWAEVVADATATLVAGGADGTRYFLWVAWKPYTVTCQVSGWTEIVEYADGTVAMGAGTGSMKVAVYYRDWVSGITNPTIDFSASPNVAGWVMQRWSGTAGATWDTPLFSRAPWLTTPSSNYYLTANSGAVAVPDGAVVMCALAVRAATAAMLNATDAIKDTAALITWNGNYVNSPATLMTTATGNDMAVDLGHRFVTTGATATLQGHFQLSGTRTGAMVWIVQGETAGAPSDSAAFFALF